MPDSRLQSLISELRRRRVFRVAGVYAVLAWATIQVADTVFPRLALPDWTVTLVVALAVLGFPTVLVLAWVFDLTPDGVRRTDADAALGDAGAPQTRRRAPLYAALVATIALVGAGAYAYVGGRSAPGGEERARVASIAVLPFADMSPGKDQEYFSDGLAEELLDALAKVGGLDVAARTSSFAYKGRSENVRTIGSELGVEAVLEGSVRKAGNRVRITAQLVDVGTGYHLWRESYDREMDDIFAVQDEISRAIVAALGFGTEQAPAIQRYTDNLAAYELYLQGRFQQWRAFDGPDPERELLGAIESFERALRLDSAYTLAWAGMADVYAHQLADNVWPPELAYPKAKQAALRALELDPDLSDTQLSLALVHYWGERDFEAAERAFERAIQSDPTNAIARMYYGRFLDFALGRSAEAVAQAERAMNLSRETNNVWPLTVRARNGQGDAVVDSLERAVNIDSADGTTIDVLSWVYLAAHRTEDFAAHYDRFLAGTEMASRPNHEQALFASTLALAGRTAVAETTLASLIEASEERYVSPDLIALLLAGLGRHGEAFEWLGRAEALGSGYLVDELLYAPAFNEMRDEPRFRALLRRLGLPS